MYRHLERRLAQHVREFLRRTYDLDLPKIVIEQPPKVEFGEYALPLAFELAKKLRKAPRKLIQSARLFGSATLRTVVPHATIRVRRIVE